MNKLILQEFVSIDGFCADRDKTTGFFDGTYNGLAQDVDEHQGDFCKSINLILLGTNTYKMFVEYWPNATSEDSAVTEAINSIPKIVFSKSLNEVQWGNYANISLEPENAVEQIRLLKETGNGNMVMWGSLSLAQSLLQANLFDEIQLMVVPVAIGKGYRLFPENSKLLPLKLTKQQTFSDGTQLNVYKPDSATAVGS